MDVKINTEKQGNISVIALYTFYKFPPSIEFPIGYVNDTLIDQFRTRNLALKSSNRITGSGNFTEYDFKYKVNKDNLGDELIANLFDSNLSKLINNSPSNAELLSNIIFPTLSENSTSSDYFYFGSTNVNSNVITQIPIPELIWKIELYEEGVEKNNEDFGGFIDIDFLQAAEIKPTTEPIAIITLGPDSKLVNNNSDLYFEFDPLISNRTIELDNTDYLKLSNEIISKSELILSINESSSDISANLSFNSWELSENPNRHLNQYLIRVDEFNEKIDSFNGLSLKNDFIIDELSGNLLGKVSESILIKDRLNKRLSSRINNNNNFIPSISYKSGDVVYFLGKNWQSLSNNNLNNDPRFSNKWVLRESLSTIYADQVSIRTVPAVGGKVSENDSITIPVNNTPIKFDIIENLGYRLNNINPCTLNGINLENLIDYSLITDESTWKSTLTITNWNKIIGNKFIDFNFNYEGIPLVISAIYKGAVVNYSDWTSEIDSDLKITASVLRDNSILQIPIDNSSLLLSPNDELKLVISGLVKFQINNITNQFTKDYTNQSELVNAVEDDNVATTDNITVDFSKGNLIFEITDEILSLNFSKSVGYVVNLETVYVNYAGSGELDFYEGSESITFSQLEILNSDNVLLRTLTSSQLNKSIYLPDGTIVKFSKVGDIFKIVFENTQSSFNLRIY